MIRLKDIQQKLRSGSFSELARGSFRAFLLRIGGIGVSYLFTLAVTRLYGTEVYGIFMLAYTLAMLGVMIGCMGVDTVMLRWVSSLRAEGRETSIPAFFSRALQLLLPWGLFLSLLLWIEAPWIRELLFDDPGALSYIRGMSLAIVPMTFVFVASEGLRGLKRVTESLLLRRVLPFGVAAVGVLILSAYGGELVPVKGFLLGSGAAVLLGLYFWSRRIGWKGELEEARSDSYRALLRVGFPLFLSSSMFFIMNWIDLAMLGYFLGDDEVGVYSVAMRVANLNNVALFAVNMIAAPKFSEKYTQGDLEGLGRMVGRATQMVFGAVLPVVLILFLFPGPVLSLFGAEFGEGRTALLLLALGKFLNAACGSVMYFLQMTGREKVGRNILGVSAIANVGMNLFFIPLWGIEGGALASMLAVAGWNIYGGIYIWKHYGILTFFWPFYERNDRNQDR